MLIFFVLKERKGSSTKRRRTTQPTTGRRAVEPPSGGGYGGNGGGGGEDGVNSKEIKNTKNLGELGQVVLENDSGEEQTSKVASKETKKVKEEVDERSELSSHNDKHNEGQRLSKDQTEQQSSNKDSNENLANNESRQSESSKITEDGLFSSASKQEKNSQIAHDGENDKDTTKIKETENDSKSGSDNTEESSKNNSETQDLNKGGGSAEFSKTDSDIQGVNKQVKTEESSKSNSGSHGLEKKESTADSDSSSFSSGVRKQSENKLKAKLKTERSSQNGMGSSKVKQDEDVASGGIQGAKVTGSTEKSNSDQADQAKESEKSTKTIKTGNGQQIDAALKIDLDSTKTKSKSEAKKEETKVDSDEISESQGSSSSSSNTQKTNEKDMQSTTDKEEETSKSNLKQPEKTIAATQKDSQVGSDAKNKKANQVNPPKKVIEPKIKNFKSEAQTLLDELETKVEDENSKTLLQTLKQALNANPRDLSIDSVAIQIMAKANNLEEMAAVFETLSEVITKQSQLSNASTTRADISQKTLEVVYHRAKANFLASKLRPDETFQTDSKVYFLLEDFSKDLKNAKDSSEFQRFQELADAELQYLERKAEIELIVQDHIYLDIYERRKHALDDVKSVKYFKCAIELYQLGDTLADDSLYESLKSSNFEFSEKTVKELCADSTGKYNALLDLLDKYFDLSSPYNYSHFRAIRAAETLAAFEPSLKADVDKLSNYHLNINSEDKERAECQSDLDSFIKNLREVDIAINIESIKSVLKYIGKTKSLVKILEFTINSPEYLPLKNDLDDFLEAHLASNFGGNFKDLLALVNGFLTKPDLPIFLFYYLEMVRDRLTNTNQYTWNLFLTLSQYAALKLHLDVNYHHSLANWLREAYPQDFAAGANAVPPYPEGGHLQRYYACKTVVSNIENGDDSYVQDEDKIWRIVFLPFVNSKIDFHKNIANTESIAYKLNNVAGMLRVTSCFAGKDNLSSHDVLNEVEKCILEKVKGIGDQVTILDLLMQLHTIHRVAESGRVNMFSLLVSVLQRMKRDVSPNEMRKGYLKAVQEEFPLIEALINASIVPNKPTKIKDMLLENPLRLNPNFGSRNLPELAAKLWKEELYSIINNTFMKSLHLRHPDTVPDLDQAFEVLQNVIFSLFRHYERHAIEYVHSDYSTYLEVSFIISKSYDQEPFKLDPQQEEIIKGDSKNHRALAYLM